MVNCNISYTVLNILVYTVLNILVYTVLNILVYTRIMNYFHTVLNW